MVLWQDSQEADNRAAAAWVSTRAECYCACHTWVFLNQRSLLSGAGRKSRNASIGLPWRAAALCGWLMTMDVTAPQGYFYYIFGFLFLVGVLTVIITVEVSIVCTYVQLCAEDYQWWCALHQWRF